MAARVAAPVRDGVRPTLLSVLAPGHMDKLWAVTAPHATSLPAPGGPLLLIIKLPMHKQGCMLPTAGSTRYTVDRSGPS
eukprot:COSAG01_NODE_4834_length_4701_cov_158.807692_3_plen_79_part_00